MALIRKVVLWDNELFVYDDGHIEKRFRGTTKMHTISQRLVDGYRKIHLKKQDQKYTTVAVHRIMYLAHNPLWDILNVSTSNLIDHIDNNRTNNNIENLRVVNSQQNCFNRIAKGYYWVKRDKKWRARIIINYEAIHLGIFDTELEASNAYQTAKLKYHII